MLFYLVLIVVYRPYEGCFSNLSIIFNEFLALLAFSLALVSKFFRIDSYIETLSFSTCRDSSSYVSSSRSSEHSFTFAASAKRRENEGKGKGGRR